MTTHHFHTMVTCKSKPSLIRNTCVNLLKALGGLALLGCVTTAGAVQPITTSGNKVLFGGQVGSISGNSLYWSIWGPQKYYNANVVKWLKDDWRSDVVRAAMAVDDGEGESYLQNPGLQKARVKAVVDAAIANDMYVIIDWHSHHAHDHTNESVAFFREMAQTYKNTPNVIFEIFNEPWQQFGWSSTIKPYAETVIGAIRDAGANNLVVVGTREWSQRVDEAADNPITRYGNIAYTLHFYAGTHGQYLRDHASYALSKGIPLFVTEWGSVNADGNGGVNYSETAAWVAFMKANNISNANWALSDLNEGSAALRGNASTSGNWVGSDLTASGANAKDIIYNWPSAGGGPVDPVNPICSTVQVPATVQAEAYCGMLGIKLESTSDEGGGQNVGYIDSGDWLNYTIDVPAAGTYKVSYRVASAVGGGVLQLEQAGGASSFGSVNIASTGGWQYWVTVSHNVNFAAGKQSIAIAAKSGGFNINWMKIESTGPVDPTNPASIIVQGEDYIANNGVKNETTSDTGGGSNVGYIDAGDWMSYSSVSIPISGIYTVEYRVASMNGGGSLIFEEAGGTPAYNSINIPSTGGWQNWTTIKHTLNLSAGAHRFGIKVNNGGWNLNWFKITKTN